MKWTYFAIALVAVLYLLESNNVIDVDGNRTGESTSAIAQAIEQGSSRQPVNSIHEKWKADTAMYFYQSISLYNYPHAAKYVTEPKIILAMEDGNGRLTVKENSYRVKEVKEEGVVMLFSRFCYPDLESMVYMDHTPAGFRIDFRRTLKEQIRNVPSNHVPVRQYCYDFKDQTLQGNIMGGDWQPTRVEKNTVNFPGGPENRIAFVNERCELYPDCTFINDNNKSGYILYVTHLDLTGTGGNLGGTEYVHLFRYPDYNQSFYEGSYRVTQFKANFS